MIFSAGTPLKVLSVGLHSKSHQKSSKCQNLLTGWHLEFLGGYQWKKSPCITYLGVELCEDVWTTEETTKWVLRRFFLIFCDLCAGENELVSRKYSAVVSRVQLLRKQRRRNPGKSDMEECTVLATVKLFSLLLQAKYPRCIFMDSWSNQYNALWGSCNGNLDIGLFHF